MALSRRTGQRFQASIWPGFVDAMTGLLLVLMFVLTISKKRVRHESQFWKPSGQCLWHPMISARLPQKCLRDSPQRFVRNAS